MQVHVYHSFHCGRGFAAGQASKEHGNSRVYLYAFENVDMSVFQGVKKG